MLPEILLSREGESYQLLHGYLHLCTALHDAGETVAHASGEGEVKVVRKRGAIRIESRGHSYPLVQSKNSSLPGKRPGALEPREDSLLDMEEMDL